MTAFAQRVTASRPFHFAIIAVILGAGVLAGLETDAALVARHGELLRALDATVLAIFVIEIVLKITAHGRRPFDYFRDGWNIFDFAIVALCLLPLGGPFGAVLRLVRTLRLLRLITALPRLQLLVGALLKSLSSMGYVSLLLGLIFYIYAVLGIHLFGPTAPQYFGSLPAALMSLFQMITLDNWSDLFHSVRDSAPLAGVVYFVSFILLGTMIMLNLFIGVIMNSMSEMHAELAEEKQPAPGRTEATVQSLDQELAALQSRLASVREKLARTSS